MSFYGGITGGINQTNKTLTSIVTVSDGFVTISGGNINNVNSLDVLNLEVGNLVVDTQATFNNVIGNISSYNIINSNVYNGNIGNINLITSNIINSGNANINNIYANQAIVNDLFLSNINVQNGNVSGNLFLNNINSYSGSVNIFSDLYVYGNISYTYSNIVRYTDRNLELNYGGTNTSAVGGGISILGTSNAILGNIYLDSLNNWNLTSTTNQVNLGNLSSSNINNSGLLNSGSAIIGGTQSYALYLNRSAGVANIGCEIRNNGLGNTIIQPIQQGTLYRNTLLNPYGGVVTIGTLTPINNNELLYVQGTGNIINLISNNGNITNINNNLLTSNIITSNVINSINGNITNITNNLITSNIITSNVTNVITGNITNITSNVIISGNANINNFISNNANITNIISNSANISNISSSNIDVNDLNVNNKIFCAERIISDRMVSRSSAIGSLNVNEIKSSFMSFVNQGLFRIEYGTTNTVNTTIRVQFQKPFNNPPTVIALGYINSATPPFVYVRDITLIDALLYAKDSAGNYGNLRFTWLAIGF